MTAMTVEGRELLEVIQRHSILAWARFESKNPTICTVSRTWTEDRSMNPPSTSFRFREESPEFIDRLMRAVKSYRGVVQWEMQGRKRDSLPGTNWVIRPAALNQKEPSSSSEGDQYERMGQCVVAGHEAYSDLKNLAAHVDRFLGGERRA